MLSLASPASLRGLSVLNDRVVWVSGSGGTVGLSLNGGISWKWMVVPGYGKTDFRDIEAFSESEAVIMGITGPAVVLKTNDGGSTWTRVFEDSSRSAFLDALDFSGDEGLLLGDPQQGKILLARSRDRGSSWTVIHPPQLPDAAPGEAFFAASGTNICLLPGGHYAFVSGGRESALYSDSLGKIPLRMLQGRESTGANSLAVNPRDTNMAFIAGGDFAADSSSDGNALCIRFHPFRQQAPLMPPHGYRSCVEYLDAFTLVCCGSSGVDISEDGGLHWKLISRKSFHVCRKARSGHRVFFAGANGAVGCLVR
jgi:photosystem II stability/assembly factor-like uncharacterized protein